MTLSPAATRPASLAVLALAEPMPGFPRYRDYVLVGADTDGLLFWLQSVAPDGPRFLAASAARFFPDYAPVLTRTVRAELDLEDPADAQLYCLLTVPRGDVGSATANLRAPVVVNPVAGRARQVVLADATHPIRRPLRR
ncbi:flagellar assembly protein FliW [Geodermatophilus sp. SYSU D00691]